MTNLKKYSNKTLLTKIPAYIAEKLNAIQDTWLKTEAEVKKEGGEYDANARMYNNLTNAINRENVNSALQNTGNYNWLDYYLGVAGKGLFINKDFEKKADKKAISTIRIWRDTILKTN